MGVITGIYTHCQPRDLMMRPRLIMKTESRGGPGPRAGTCGPVPAWAAKDPMKEEEGGGPLGWAGGELSSRAGGRFPHMGGV